MAAAMRVAVVGASAGGVEALQSFVAELPADLGCAVVVVLHVAPSGTSVLPQILDRAGALTAVAARDGAELRAGCIHVAPPDCHVLVDGDALVLSGGPRENGHRPAIDPTMRTASAAYGAACCGIVLSGTRDDGTAGLAAIKAGGGLTLVQDPADALYPAMPLSAIAYAAVDAVGSVGALAARLMASAGGSPRALGPAAAAPAAATARAFGGGGPAPVGTRFTCPDCGGVLWEAVDGGVVQLHCSVGHVSSPESLAAEHGRELERALWVARRALADRAALMGRMAERAERGGHPASAEKFSREADEATAHAETVLRSMDELAEAPVNSSGGAELA